MPKSFIRTLLSPAAILLFVGAAMAQQAPTPATVAPAPKKTTKPAATPAQNPPALTTEKDKFSYAVGMSMGANFKKQSVPVSPEVLLRGLKDALAGKTLLTEDEAHAAIAAMQDQFRKQQQAKMQAVGEANKKEGATFLPANKAKEGVVTTASGLQYKILTAGTGAKPTATDTVSVNYRGTLINGTEFDSSYKRGQPATFPVNGVIKGWTEALQLMPVGSKWQLFIPSDLAYGEHGAGNDIGPNATLIFEVELLSIQPKKEAEKPAAAPEAKPEAKPDDKK